MIRIKHFASLLAALVLLSPATARAETLEERMQAALVAQGPDYEPRTRHLKADGRPKYINRLIFEASPYLLQHAHNPVAWRAWGDEAFVAAKETGKPVFLSIGYSTCYWCHVLERETFEDEAAARFINENFIPVKVDRERRPDIDEIHSIAMQIRVGVVGHPINSFLTPEGDVFAVTGYAPPDIFRERLEIIAGAWAEDPGSVRKEGEMLTSVIRLISAGSAEGGTIDQAGMTEALNGVLASADLLTGGFADRQAKFPRAPVLDFLLDQYLRDPDQDIHEALTLTLEAIARGGLTDHLGGGFFRYTTDPNWEAPHFEKMLYSQAELSRILVKAGIALNEPRFTRAGERAAQFVMAHMTAPIGSFYSALDAESEGVEGKYYLWRPEDIAELLPTDAEAVSAALSIQNGGAFEGASVPILSDEAWEDAASLIAHIPTLTTARDQRIPPAMDQKIITSWNGMMIASLAEIAMWTGDDTYLSASVKAANAVWAHAHRGNGQLWRIRLGAESSTPGLLADYAHLARAFIMLFDATGEKQWLSRAQLLTNYMMASFKAVDSALLHAAEPSQSASDIPSFPTSDEPYASGNATALAVFVALSHRLEDPSLALAASRLQSALASRAVEDPLFHAASLKAMATNFSGEAGRAGFGAGGRVKASIAATPSGAEITIAVADGWHINSREPLQDYLIPTRIVAIGTRPTLPVTYPEPNIRVLGFQTEPLALLEGQVKILIQRDKGERPQAFRLYYQACSDEICLPPEEMVLLAP